MKKNSFITLFVTAHIVLIFLQVHKHTLFIKNNYNQQQYEKQFDILKEKKQVLTQQLYALKDREAIKLFAQNKLHMRPYTLKQITKLPDYDTKL